MPTTTNTGGPGRMIEQAESAIIGGDLHNGARLAYEAAHQAAVAAAGRLGWPAQTETDIFNLMYALDGITPPPVDLSDAIAAGRWAVANMHIEPHYSLGYDIATDYLTQAESNHADRATVPELYWDESDFVKLLPKVREFITQVKRAQLPEAP